MGYDAFISYSHDTDGDRAKAIEDGLERFAKPWYRRRSLSVFRDSSGLSANPGLWTSLTAVMADSERLVVLCSPESAASPWVGREIEQWIATKPTGRILPVLTAGELAWNDELGTFDPVHSTAAHPALATAFAEEPLWTDLRFADDPQLLTLREPRFLEAIAVLAAPMHGVPKDELIGEDIRQHRRTLRFAWAAVLALLLLAFGTFAGAATAFNKANEAQRYADEIVAANESLQKLEQERDRVEAQRKTVEKDLAAQEEALSAAEDRLDRATADTAAANAETATAQAETATANAQAANRPGRCSRGAGRRDGRPAGGHRRKHPTRCGSGRRPTRRRRSRRRQIRRHGRGCPTRRRSRRRGGRGCQPRSGEVRRDQGAGGGHGGPGCASSAERLQLAAEQGQVKAERAQADAEEQRVIADQRAAASRQVAQEQSAIAKATRLANDSNSPLLRSGRFDLSLLLANEATKVDAAVPDAHGALLTAVSDGSRIDRFLHFGCTSPATGPCVPAPQKLGHVSVSPDGQFVAAVEDSRAIGNGDAKARLYVWANAAGPSPAQVTLLAEDLGCVDDLEWLQGNVLLTVEAPLGCWNPTVKYDSVGQGIPYAATKVQMWEPDTGAHRSVCNLAGLADPDVGFPDHGLAISYQSPVSVSADGRTAAVTCELVTPDIAATYFIDGPSMAAGAGPGWDVALTDARGLTFSPSGRFASGWFDESYVQAPSANLGYLGARRERARVAGTADRRVPRATSSGTWNASPSPAVNLVRSPARRLAGRVTSTVGSHSGFGRTAPRSSPPNACRPRASTSGASTARCCPRSRCQAVSVEGPSRTGTSSSTAIPTTPSTSPTGPRARSSRSRCLRRVHGRSTRRPSAGT